jgi:hypothetical protein
MQYSFTCPITGCNKTMTVDAANDDEALNKLVDTAKGHLASDHPDLAKTDDQIRADIGPNMVKIA